MTDAPVVFKTDSDTARRLRKWVFPGLTKLLRGLPPQPPSHVDAEVYAVAHGFYCRIARTSQGALRLVDAGFGHEAAPLRRAIMEHVLALAWVIEDGAPAVRALLRAHRARMESIKDLLDDRWAVKPAHFERLLAVDLPTEGQDHLVKFGQLVKGYDPQLANDLLAAWLTDTGASHPSHTTYAAYWRDGRLATSVMDRPGNDVHAIGFLWWLGACQMDQVVQWGTRLVDIGLSAGLPVHYLRRGDADDDPRTDRSEAPTP